MISLHTPLTIERLGLRGEGIAQGPDGTVFVPYALEGEKIIAEVDGERGKLAEVVVASPDRIAPFCPHYSICGGCAVQALAAPAYAAWKRGLVVAGLKNAGVDVEVGALVDAHGAGRRRVTFHSRNDIHSRPVVGFMQARAHDIVAIEACPILAPELADALPAARAVARVLASLNKPLDIIVTASDNGLDVDIRGVGKLNFENNQALIGLAAKHDLARISNHGLVIIERRPPALKMGEAEVSPPPGGFLQATEAGENALAALVCEAVAGAKRVADLFAGVGTFALRLASTAQVHAVEMEGASLNALDKAARHAPRLRVTTEARDLFSRPLLKAELEKFDAVVFDPPRAGAEAQARNLATSGVPLVVAVSCNVQSFARDAGHLVRGGYVLEKLVPVDQFRHSAHVEMVGVFRLRKEKPKRRGRLLG